MKLYRVYASSGYGCQCYYVATNGFDSAEKIVFEKTRRFTEKIELIEDKDFFIDDTLAATTPLTPSSNDADPSCNQSDIVSKI